MRAGTRRGPVRVPVDERAKPLEGVECAERERDRARAVALRQADGQVRVDGVDADQSAARVAQLLRLVPHRWHRVTRSCVVNISIVN